MRVGILPRAWASVRSAKIVCASYAAATFAWYCVWKFFLAERSGDPAIFENSLWNAAHGNGLQTALEGGFPHLAVHFSPIFLLFLPLYQLSPSLHLIHLTVCVATAVAGYWIYRLARLKLEQGTSFLVMLAFLLNPTVILQTFMEFHEQALGLLPLVLLVYAYAIYAQGRGSMLGILGAALLLVSTREDNALLLLALAAHALLIQRRGRLGVALATLAIGWFGLYAWLARGMLGGGHLPGVFAGTYGIWGATPGEAVRNILQRPAAVIAHLASGTPLRYMVQLLAPFLGLLALADPIALVMLPQLAMILMADPATRVYEIRLHYSIVPVTLLYASAIGTLALLHTRGWRLPARLGALPLARVAAALMLVVSVGTVPMWLVRAVGRLNPDAAQVRALVSRVPAMASVTAPSYMLNEMARRPVLAFARGAQRPTTDYVILEDPRAIFFHGTTVEWLYSAAEERSLTASGYELVHRENGRYLWRLRPVPLATGVDAANASARPPSRQ